LKISINVPDIGREEFNEIKSVIQSGVLTSAAYQAGQYVQEFERIFSNFVNTKYAVAVNSGTASLQAALYALGIKSGDEVLVPSFTFVATANSIVSVGAKPVFVDIRRDNFTMEPEDLRKKITKKTKAIIPVHLYGYIAYMDEISEIAETNEIEIIEDAAQSLGSTYQGKHSGTMSQLGCFSMYAAKVATSGEGGIVVTKDREMFEKLRKIRNHGMFHGNDTSILGLNLRLPEICAAMAKIQMKKLPRMLSCRRKNAKILSDLLSDLEIDLPDERIGEKINWYLYTITLKNRDRVMKKLNSKGIGATAYYSIPIHKMPFYNKKLHLPNTQWAAEHVLSLPIHPLVQEDDLFHISKILHELIKTL
jgi:perosamine synthetase